MTYWAERMCVGCGATFSTLAAESQSPVCMECTKDFGIETNEDLQELLNMFGFNRRDENVPEKVTAAPVKKVAVDPIKVAQGIRAQCDYAVMPADGGALPTPRKPITYVCAKNGLFEVRHSEIVTITSRPKEVMGVTQELKEGIEFNLPKIPFLFLQQTVRFFRGVEERRKSSSEAIVQVWWDRETKQYIMHVPEQVVGGASVNHNSTFDQDNGGKYIHVADIHSHTSSMAAFWSGVDNRDEERVTTERLFGVIGKINQPIPDWKWRLRTRGGFVDLNITDVFEMPQSDYTFRVSSKDMYQCINDPQLFKDGRVSLWCAVSPFNADVEVPEEWYAQVKGYTTNNSGSHGWRGGHAVHGAVQQRFPSVVRGLLYIDGIEYEVQDNSMKPTGNKLIKKGEQIPDVK